MQLFDTHCHIDVAAFDADRPIVLQQARDAGVADLLVPAIARAGWDALRRLCAADSHLHPALGLHPMFMLEHDAQDIDALADAVREDPPVAIGEIGLDRHVASGDFAAQHHLLEGQLQIAEETGLPVVLHVRKAHEEMLAALRRYRLRGGFCHAFNGSLQQAGRYLDMGIRLGFGGMLTYPRSTRLRRLAAELPLDAIVLETDAPDMTGIAHQHRRNSPAYLPEVLATLAKLRSEDPAAIAQATRRNAIRVLQL